MTKYDQLIPYMTNIMTKNSVLIPKMFNRLPNSMMMMTSVMVKEGRKEVEDGRMIWMF